MQKKHLFDPARLLFAAIIALTCMVILPMCKNKEDKKVAEATNNQGGGGSNSFSMKPIILDSATLKNWVDSGWTKPKDPKGIKVLVMQFLSANAADINSNFMCLGLAGKSVAAAGSKGRVFLKTDAASEAVTFTDSVILANNCFEFNDMNIFDSSGSQNVKYIRFIPKKGTNNYLYFDTEKVNKDGSTTSIRGTNPCPPCQYCPDGCPSDSFDE